MPITGSDKALMFAQSGVARAGATRSGYASSKAFITVNGTLIEPSVTSKVILGSLTITDALDEQPNRLSMTVYGATPTKGQEVIAMLGSTNNRSRIFAGQILTATRIMVEHTETIIHRVDAIDYTWLADRRLVTKRYTNQSATAIAQDLVSTFTSGFTSANVALSLAVIDEITFTQASVSSALTQLAKRGGCYWYWDYLKDLHFFVTETDNNPVDLTTAHPSLTKFEHSTDLSQILTRIYVEGYGSTAGAEAAVGDTELQVVDDAFYSSGGGLVVAGPQHISYTAIGSGYILTPTWVTVTPPPITTPKWASAAYSPTLRRFVIVGNATVATSSDGLTWTAQTASWTGQATGLVWAAELSLFVTVTFSGEVETSPDGITWTSQTAAAANQWSAVTWAPEIPLLVAVGGSGAQRVMTSPDGITWTGQTAASALFWWAVDWSPSLHLFVSVAAQSGATSAMSSPDGVTWTSRTPSDTGNAWFCVTWSPTVGKFVAGGSTGGIMYSSNGTSWTSIADRAGAANGMNGALWVAEENRYVAVIYNTARVFWSTDAITWVEEVIPVSEYGLNGPNSLAYGAGTIIGVGDDNGANAIFAANVSDVFPLLTGIPATGTGSIQYDIAEGDAVNILEQVDDLAAQAALAALLGTGDGVVEDALQDRRLSKTEAQARGTAALALRSTAEASLRYQVRDVRSKSGKSITFNFAGVTGTFKIQEVVITGFNNDGAYPTYAAKASSTRFSLEDLLRSVRQKDAA